MKQIKLLFLSILALSQMSVNAYDTLRHYDPASANTLYFNSSTFSKQLARFDLDKPAHLKYVVLKLDGNAGSTVKLRLLGHEGGTFIPNLFNDLTNPITVTKSNDGTENVVVALDSPGVYLTNNQFFLLLEDFSSGLNIITDRTDHPISCQSNSGGTYYYQFVYRANDQSWYLPPGSVNRAFAIDVLVDYPSKESKNYFSDYTTFANIDDGLSNNSIAAGDYNNDGFLDLLISGRFYENQKNGKYKEVGRDKGVVNSLSPVVANAFVDMDNDADLDIILFGRDTSLLFINDNGNFTQHGLSLPYFRSFHSFSFADLNNDKYPDVFISQLWGAYPEPQPNFLFYNDGNLDFIDKTDVIYTDYDGTDNYPSKTKCKEGDQSTWLTNQNRNKRSRGSQFIDFDNDGDLDLFIVNYFLESDEFYQNNGDGTFTNIQSAKNIDKCNTGSNHGTGVDWYDYDNDGDLDLLLPQFAHPRFIEAYDHRGTTIYSNNGAPDYSFTDMIGQYNNYTGLKSDIGLELEETHAGGAWGDVNNDGLADILMTVFYGCRFIDLYVQNPDHSFEMKTFNYGLEGINTGTDLIWLDYDNDGRLDLGGAVSGKFRLFKHDVWNDKNHVQFDLKSTSANAFAIGARVYVYAGGESYMQEVCAGRGQKMQKPYRLHFGLNYHNSIDSVVVLWPSSPQKRETFTGLEVNNIYLLEEGGSISLSVNETRLDESIEVYPNPVTENINIDLDLPSAQTVKIELLNTLGQQVFSKNEFLKDGKHQLNYPVQKDWKEGVYFLKIYVNNTSTVNKILIRQHY